MYIHVYLSIENRETGNTNNIGITITLNHLYRDLFEEMSNGVY